MYLPAFVAIYSSHTGRDISTCFELIETAASSILNIILELVHQNSATTLHEPQKSNLQFKV